MTRWCSTLSIRSAVRLRRFAPLLRVTISAKAAGGGCPFRGQQKGRPNQLANDSQMRMDRKLMIRGRALLLYLAMSVPFGIAVHLGSEFAGLGRDADDLIFSPLHAYLGIIGIAAFAVFLVVSGVFAAPSERRRRFALLANSLPYGGVGSRFFALSAVLQFGFFAVTQIGEGCPVCRGDLFVGIAAALAASLLGAKLLAFLRRGLMIAAGLTIEFERAAVGLAVVPRLPRQTAHVAVSTFSTFASVLGNRPPPLLS